MQIGEVAERTGLSLRTIRYYEEVDLVVPSARSQGGFRLYTEGDVERLLLAKRMKPLEFSLDEMRDLFELLDELSADVALAESRRSELVERLAMYRDAVERRCAALRDQLAVAEDFAASLKREHGRQRRRVRVAGSRS